MKNNSLFENAKWLRVELTNLQFTRLTSNEHMVFVDTRDSI